jgi:hypothetical protein
VETVEIDPDLVRDLHVSYWAARRAAVDSAGPRVWMEVGIMLTLMMVSLDLECPLDGPCRWCDPDDLWR